MTLLLIAAGVIAAWAVMTFNRLTRLRQLGGNAWADIDVQLHRHHDLVPNVVAVVKGHTGYERETLEALVQTRNRAISAQGPAAQFKEEDPLAAGLNRIFAIAEAYPDLKAAA